MSKSIIVMKRDEGETLSVLGAQVKFLCTGDKTGHAWSLMEVTLPKHAGPPPHEHSWDEAYYVTQGRVRFMLEGGEQLIQAGEFLYAPGGALHGFEGDSEEPAHMLIMDAPAHAEAFFRQVDREVHSADDLYKIPEIGRRNRIFFRVKQ